MVGNSYHASQLFSFFKIPWTIWSLPLKSHTTIIWTSEPKFGNLSFVNVMTIIFCEALSLFSFLVCWDQDQERLGQFLLVVFVGENGVGMM